MLTAWPDEVVTGRIMIDCDDCFFWPASMDFQDIRCHDHFWTFSLFHFVPLSIWFGLFSHSLIYDKDRWIFWPEFNNFQDIHVSWSVDVCLFLCVSLSFSPWTSFLPLPTISFVFVLVDISLMDGLEVICLNIWLSIRFAWMLFCRRGWGFGLGSWALGVLFGVFCGCVVWGLRLACSGFVWFLFMNLVFRYF